MLYVNPLTNLIYSGSKADGGIEIPNPPSNNYKLKENWFNDINNPWELDLQSFKDRLISLVKDLYDRDHEELIFNHYPKFEPFSWYYQKEEAEAWLSLSSSKKKDAIKSLEYPWLFNACYPDGKEIAIDVIDAFSNKIIDNSRNFKLSASKLLGIKRKRLQAISECKTEQELMELEKSIKNENG